MAQESMMPPRRRTRWSPHLGSVRACDYRQSEGTRRTRSNFPAHPSALCFQNI